MTGPISPVGAAVSASVPDALDPRQRDQDGRDQNGHHQGGHRRNAAPQSTALVPAQGRTDTHHNPAKPASVSPPPPAAFAAQILGQPGKKRGLRGGPEVLDAARTTYMSREYSGPHDRRPPAGQRKKTDI